MAKTPQVASLIAQYLEFGASIPEKPRWEINSSNNNTPNWKPCTELQCAILEFVQAHCNFTYGKDEFTATKADYERYLNLQINSCAVRCTGAPPFRLMSYYCKRRTVLPSFVHPTPLLIQYKHQEVQTPLDALPDHLLIRIFKNCRRECPCFFHSKVVNTSPYLRYMYLQDYMIYTKFLPVRWNLYELAYTLCSLELVCKRFHTPSGPAKLSLPEQFAKKLCAKLGFNTLCKGKCWKQELMLLDLVAREADFVIRFKLHGFAYTEDGSKKIPAYIKEITSRWGQVDAELSVCILSFYFHVF